MQISGGGAREPAPMAMGVVGPLELLLLTLLAVAAALVALARSDAAAPGTPLSIITGHALAGAREMGLGGALALVMGAVAYAIARMAKNTHRSMWGHVLEEWESTYAAP